MAFTLAGVGIRGGGEESLRLRGGTFAPSGGGGRISTRRPSAVVTFSGAPYIISLMYFQTNQGTG